MRLNVLILMRILPALLLALALVPDIARAQGTGGQNRNIIFSPLLKESKPAQPREPRPQSPPIVFSTPTGKGTNLFNQFIKENEDTAVAVTDDAFRAPQSMLPVRSLEGAKLPQRSQQPSAAETRKLKEELDKQKNWVFGDPAAPPPGTTPEEIFHLNDVDASGRPVELRSLVMKYLERQAAKGQAAEKTKKQSQQNEEGNTANGIRKLLDPSYGGLSGRDSDLSQGVPGIFVPQRGFDANRGFGVNGYDPKPTAAEIAQKARMEEFNTAIGMAGADNPLNNPLKSSSSANSVGADWNPYLSSAKPAPPKKAPPSLVNASVVSAIPKPVAPTVTKPVKSFVQEPLFNPAFSAPRRRVQ